MALKREKKQKRKIFCQQYSFLQGERFQAHFFCLKFFFSIPFCWCLRYFGISIILFQGIITFSKVFSTVFFLGIFAHFPNEFWNKSYNTCQPCLMSSAFSNECA